MISRFFILCFALIVLLSNDASVASEAESTTNYFPGAFNKFRQRWYSKHLEAMQEPVLFNGEKNSKSVYRFLWLRSFHHPVMIRIENRNNGRKVIIAKELNGAGGYHPGKLVVDQQNNLSEAAFGEFKREVEQGNFWSLPTDQNSCGDDGARWILEAYKDGKYHVVDRWTEPETEIHKLGRLMMKLSKISPDGPMY